MNIRHYVAMGTSTDVIPRLCSLAAAADVLGMSVSAALRRVHTGQLPVLGKLEGQTGSYVLDLDEIEALAAEGRQ